jgi:hypothetical protein
MEPFNLVTLDDCSHFHAGSLPPAPFFSIRIFNIWLKITTKKVPAFQKSIFFVFANKIESKHIRHTNAKKSHHHTR